MSSVMRTFTATAIAATGIASCAHSETEQARGITVFAAASLQKVFTELGKQFEAQHPGTSVRFTFAGSPTLVAQLDQGARGDVLASADEANMDRARESQLVGEARVFATNRLVIVTARGNPKRIAKLADLANPDLAVVVCAAQVPCGALAGKVEAKAGVVVRARSQEPSVADVLAKVASGEADAGLVYSTDASAAGGTVSSVPVPEGDALATRYPIAVLDQAKGGPRGATAEAFVALVLSPQGQEVFGNAGFGKP
ncbi:molybdate ABC transporter substrate-binding protein [Segniliparus rotundus]|nr:molybdate ABC transporter substrate-binding protein [Segniliparus rotundus]